MCGRPGIVLHVEGLTKEVVQEVGSASLCHFPRPVFGSDGDHISGDFGRVAEHTGVGAGKAKRYGEEFCKLIKRHCEENEIERPEDLRVRTVANKSKMKVAIIQAIDRKVALDDIAMSKGIEFEELLDEIEAIVYSGTKLNIDYFLDEDHLLDIYDYFKESTTDKIDDALDELGDDFTEEEVRLVRIKFISEMAN